MSFAPLDVVGLCRFIRFSCKKLIMPFYAVARGKTTGVFDSWDKCRASTEGFSKPLFKSFKTEEEAVQFCIANGAVLQQHVSGAMGAKYSEVIEVMDSDDNAEENIQGCGLSTTNEPSSENKIFDFASFSQRLTNLEDTYKKKMKELEDRIEALESGQLMSKCSDADFEELFNPVSEATKPTRAVAALKRTSSKADFRDNTSNKKPRTSQKIRVTSNDGSSYEFDADEEGFVQVFTDGACSKNGRSNSKAGVGVWFGEDHPLNISEPVQGRATNNMAEIQAATWAIQQAIRAGIKKVCVFTDSQFTIQCITAWIKKWKRNGWKTEKGDVINREELEVLDKVVNYPGVNVKWEYVKGHSGQIGNERADSLARKGAVRYKGADPSTDHPWQQYFAT